jgi:antitoxin component YwqK of YwqJK toxin-antitoxin module
MREITTYGEHFLVDKNDLVQGEYKEYYHNGQLKSHLFYQDGCLHGECKFYYDNGQLKEHAFCQHNILHGESFEYTRSGRLRKYACYENGEFHGECSNYTSNIKNRYRTFFYHGTDLNVDPSTLSKEDKLYIMMSGRLPPRGEPC